MAKTTIEQGKEIMLGGAVAVAEKIEKYNASPVGSRVIQFVELFGLSDKFKEVGAYSGSLQKDINARCLDAGLIALKNAKQ